MIEMPVSEENVGNLNVLGNAESGKRNGRINNCGLASANKHIAIALITVRFC